MTVPSELEIVRSRDGWQFEIDDLLIVAQAPHLDRGSIRAAITVTKGGAALWTQNVNLTSAISRKSFIKALAERQVKVMEGHLIAVEKVCREKPPERGGFVPPIRHFGDGQSCGLGRDGKDLR